MILPATLDRESRGEFWRYLGRTFQMHVEAGVPRDEARRFAVQDTDEMAAKYIERQTQ
jgi:hypothetical protein